MITCVDEPMDWLSSITYIQKANGKLHLCLDPGDLNEATCRDHHKMPTVEEVTHEFAHSCFFTKLDACHGYWSIVPQPELQHAHYFQQPFWKILFPATSLWSGLLPRHLPRKRWTRSSRNAKDVSESQTTSPYMATLRQNMMPAYEISCISPTNTTWCSTHRRHT